MSLVTCTILAAELSVSRNVTVSQWGAIATGGGPFSVLYIAGHLAALVQSPQIPAATFSHYDNQEFILSLELGGGCSATLNLVGSNTTLSLLGGAVPSSACRGAVPSSACGRAVPSSACRGGSTIFSLWVGSTIFSLRGAQYCLQPVGGVAPPPAEDPRVLSCMLWWSGISPLPS